MPAQGAVGRGGTGAAMESLQHLRISPHQGELMLRELDSPIFCLLNTTGEEHSSQGRGPSYLPDASRPNSANVITQCKINTSLEPGPKGVFKGGLIEALSPKTALV